MTASMALTAEVAQAALGQRQSTAPIEHEVIYFAESIQSICDILFDGFVQPTSCFRSTSHA